jgi:outer membrane autotransporter protein
MGAYATFLNGGFFADSLVMANFTDMQFRAFNLPNLHSDVLTFGSHLDVGYRFNMPGGWFAEPLGSIEYVKAVFDDLVVPATTIGLDGDSLRGRLGARFGTSWMSGTLRLEPSLTLSLWHLFQGHSVATLTSGGFIFDLNDPNLQRTYGEIGGALNVFDVATRWSGFLKGDIRFGENDYVGGSAKGGFRYQWN